MLRKSLDPDSDLLLDLDSMKMDPKHYRSWSRPEKRGKQGEVEKKKVSAPENTLDYLDF